MTEFIVKNVDSERARESPVQNYSSDDSDCPVQNYSSDDSGSKQTNASK